MATSSFIRQKKPTSQLNNFYKLSVINEIQLLFRKQITSFQILSKTIRKISNSQQHHASLSRYHAVPNLQTVIT